MIAREAKLLDLLKKSPQFVIPIYQRTYSWTATECRQLWDDVSRAGREDGNAVHFVGSIVYVEQSQFRVMHQPPLLVIDGQQRLTTVTLLLAALAEALGESEPLDGFSRRKVRNYYLVNPEEEGDRHFKLLLSQTDEETLTAIVSQSPAPKEHSVRVSQNYKLFQELLAQRKGTLVAVCRGLAKLVVVDVALSRDHDNPQLIFESMNSTGRELSQADLIRNYVLMGLESSLQTRLYKDFWRPMEVAFGQEAYGTHFDGFMRHFLTVKTGDIPNIGEVYEEFKKYARPEIARDGVEELVRDVREFAGYYCAMALGAESDERLKAAFQDLRELRADVAYPFLLGLYADYENGILPHSALLEAVRLIEAYVFRRAICAIPTNSMNRTFSGFAKSLRKGTYLESIQAHFLLLPSYRRFPTDEEFGRDLQTRDLYNFRSRTYWLRRLENHGRKERVAVDEYTIEHILPQNENLSNAWRKALGPEWERVQKTWLHTLGNLTLTGYNSVYSDKPFPEKRDVVGGFKESPLRLNAGLGTVDEWTEVEIRARAVRLASGALKVWASPSLPVTTLDAYRPKRGSGTAAYTLQDHPQLALPSIRVLFDTLRKEILALDPCVTEEILKLYIAYKAETNFVDIVPQAKRLRLSLNMSFADIVDPKNVCKDVTALGRWGNGDIEVGISSLDEVPYAIGLVRQSLERQMGNGGD